MSSGEQELFLGARRTDQNGRKDLNDPRDRKVLAMERTYSKYTAEMRIGRWQQAGRLLFAGRLRWRSAFYLYGGLLHCISWFEGIGFGGIGGRGGGLAFAVEDGIEEFGVETFWGLAGFGVFVEDDGGDGVDGLEDDEGEVASRGPQPKR